MNKLAGETESNRNLKSSNKSWFSAGGFLLGIRDVIEEHAKSVAAVNKTFIPNIHLEIDEKRKKRNREIEEKGKKLADELNLSVHSCCTKMARFYRSMTDEQPIRQHNKPLTHLMRTNQRLMIEDKQFAEDDRRKKEAEKNASLKQKLQAFSMKTMQREFRGGVKGASIGQIPVMSMKIQKKWIEEF